MKLKVLIAFMAVLALFSCNGDNDRATKKPKSIQRSETKTANVSNKTPSIIKLEPKFYLIDSLPLTSILMNGHKPLMSLKFFQKSYPKPDSIRKTLWECGSPFDSLDEAWMVKTYGAWDTQAGTFKNYDSQVTTIYINGASYATNGHLALLIKADASRNAISIPSHRIALSSHTSIATFNKLFPKTHPEKTDDQSIIRYRIPVKYKYDDAFLFYFKNGKFDHIELWYLLC